MKKVLIGMAVVLCLFVGLVSANKASGDGNDSITVSPNVLILDKPGSSFSIHSNIDYSSVVISSLELTADGTKIDPIRASADSIGDLKIKVKRQVIQDIAKVGSMTFTLKGEKKDGSAIDVSDTITVKSGGKKQKGQD
jgi:hypothetical protein